MADGDAAPKGQAEPLLAGFMRFALSSVGAKAVMAITGLGLWLFIVGHLAGNLLMWAGQDAMNHYAEALKGNALLLWGTRSALLIGFPLHILSAIRASRLNTAARPIGYVVPIKTPATLGGRTMMYTGLLLLAFLLYHLAHFTWHLTNPGDVTLLPNGQPDVYSMVIRGFSVLWISAIYIVGQLLLAQHLSHGIYSLNQHLGLWGRSWTPFVRTAAVTIGWGVAIAFISIPIGVLAGVLRLP